MEEPQQDAQTVTVEMEIPGNKAGAIIGKGGEMIKRLQSQFCVKMDMQQESTEAMGQKTLKITGHPNSVKSAKETVEAMLLQTPERTNNLPPIRFDDEFLPMVEVVVPRSCVGSIIGKGGETIKRLQAESNTTIQFKPDDGSSSSDRVVTVRGLQENINYATTMMAQLVQRSAIIQQMGGQQIQQAYMAVPADKAGLVVGRGGETIRQIQQQTGARVGMSRDPPQDPNQRIVNISGTQEQILLVRHIIGTKIGDIPVGTSLPSSQFQGFAQGTGMMRQSTAVPINPQTGQPDYSAAWAEYYRQMGMDQQADEIENQLRERQRQSTHYNV